jgi:uncharacterized membrane protein
LAHPAALPELQAHYGERYRWLLLLAVMVGTMAAVIIVQFFAWSHSGGQGCTKT